MYFPLSHHLQTEFSLFESDPPSKMNDLSIFPFCDIRWSISNIGRLGSWHTWLFWIGDFFLDKQIFFLDLLYVKQVI